MKKVLKITEKTEKYLETLPSIYLIACWARYGIAEYKLACWKKIDQEMIPMVYCYEDYNGTHPSFILIPITETTTGSIVTWTARKYVAEKIVDALNIFSDCGVHD